MAVDRIARVQMDDRCAGFSRGDGGVFDLLRRDRQIRRHRGRVNRAGDGAGDDHFSLCGHEIPQSVVVRSCRCRSCVGAAPAVAGRAIASVVRAHRAPRAGRAPRRPAGRSRLPTRSAPAGRRPGADRTRCSVRSNRRRRPGALSSIVANGPMNDQRSPSPSRTVLSRSSGEITAIRHQSHRLRQQRTLQAIQDEAVDLTTNAHGHLSHRAHDRRSRSRASLRWSTARRTARPPAPGAAD